MKTSATIIVIVVAMIGIGSLPEVKAAATGSPASDARFLERSQMISEKAFRNVFNTYLHENLGKDKSDIVLSRLRISNNKPIPEGSIDYQLFQKSKSGLKGHVTLTAIIKVDGAPQNEVKLSGWVDVFSPVVCVSRNVRKGDVLRGDDIHLVRKNTSRLPATVLKDKERVLGLTVKHSLKQGASLKAWMLERSPVLIKGDLVIIHAELGSIRVTVPGRIMEKGYQGELIKVQNAMSSKEIYARVIDNSTVTVDF